MSDHGCKFDPCFCRGSQGSAGPVVHAGRCCILSNTMIYEGHRVVISEVQALMDDGRTYGSLYLRADEDGVNWRIDPEDVRRA